MGRTNILLAIKLGFIALSILFYLIALVAEVYYQTIPNDTMHGFECLLIGWLAFFIDWGLFFAWFSNLMFFASLIMSFWRISGFIAIPIMGIAILLTIPAFTLSELMYNEAGMMTPVEVKYGVYIWMFSYITLFVGLFIPATWKKKIDPLPESQTPINEIP